MTSPAPNKISKTIAAQPADVIPSSQFCLSNLPPELMTRIASFARESFGQLRATCKQIERSLREVTKKATLKEEAFDGPEVPVTPLKPLKFSELREIDSGLVPLRCVEFPTYSNLQKIAVRSPGFVTDAFLNSLSLMPHLRALKVGNCLYITTAGWTNFFKNLPNLEELNLRCINLNNTEGLRVVDLPKLLSFKLNDTVGSNDQFLRQILKAAHQLRKLKIGGYPQLTSDIFNAISSDKLTKFELVFTEDHKVMENLDWNIVPFVDFIRRCNHLRELCINSCQYNELFSNYQNLELSDFCHKNLRILNLQCITLNEIRFVLCCAPKLEELKINYCYIRSGSFEPLYGLSELKVLDLCCNEGFFEEDFQALTVSTSNLSKLSIGTEMSLSKDVWRKSNLESLRDFNFDYLQSDSTVMTISDIGDLARAMPNPQYLSLGNYDEDYCYEETTIEDENLGDLRDTFLNLKSLKLSNFTNFTNFKLLYLLGRAPELERIELVDLENLTDSIALQLITNLPKLKNLMFQCSKITEEVLNTPRDASIKIIKIS